MGPVIHPVRYHASSSGLCLVCVKRSLSSAPGQHRGGGQKRQIYSKALKCWSYVLLTYIKTNVLAKSLADAGHLWAWNVKRAPKVISRPNSWTQTGSRIGRRHLWGLKYGLQECPAGEDSPGPGHVHPSWPDSKSSWSGRQSYPWFRFSEASTLCLDFRIIKTARHCQLFSANVVLPLCIFLNLKSKIPGILVDIRQSNSEGEEMHHVLGPAQPHQAQC